ncbi:MAG: hypothetical protein RBT65_18680 [Methanolobus sp.]|jgi:hypothetical protein|uniref:hypothetical protein n=1 Tax=Methanothrix sp. TaxID=90426 RepID=UPI001B48A8A1|nr:hypothetical protein [Methanothrix sp.]MBP7068419.1 hypothetical protein [Methanothrix sp.]MDY0389104.1 hypothetical protein [Methanolobus sp.]
MNEKETLEDIVIKNFKGKSRIKSTRSCGDDCGPCTCPGGDICATVAGVTVGGSAESIGYAGGVAGDLSA